MDGLLVIDKPPGPTSHDVVARLRRVLGERRIGHTGTLDPAASGVLPLVLGRATRLARFLSNASKSYEAVVRFGYATDTYDSEGQPVGERSTAPVPAREQIESALATFRGTFDQQPPAFSAKKIAGQRSYVAARASRSQPAGPAQPAVPALPALPALPAPVTVTVHRADILAVVGDCATVSIECSAGFYVRSLAHDLGVRLGVGAHLAALRRTASAGLTLADAMPLDAAERSRDAAIAAIVPLGRMLSGLAVGRPDRRWRRAGDSRAGYRRRRGDDGGIAGDIADSVVRQAGPARRHRGARTHAGAFASVCCPNVKY